MELIDNYRKLIIPLVGLAVVFVFSEFYASAKKDEISSDLKPVEVIPHEQIALNKLLKEFDQPKLIQKKSTQNKFNEWQSDGLYPTDPQALKKQSNKKPINIYPVQTLSKQTLAISKPVTAETSKPRSGKADTSKLNVEAKTMLRITGAESVNELNYNKTEDMHNILIYYKHYKRCEIENAKGSYLYNKKEELAKNSKLGKSQWNNFIKKQLNEKLVVLTKENLFDKLKECRLETQNIIVKLNEFDKNWKDWLKKS